FSRASWRWPPNRNGRSRSRWIRRMIIGLGSSPDQSRQINHLLTGRSFGEGQGVPSARTTGVILARDEIPTGRTEIRGLSPESNYLRVIAADDRKNTLTGRSPASDSSPAPEFAEGSRSTTTCRSSERSTWRRAGSKAISATAGSARKSSAYLRSPNLFGLRSQMRCRVIGSGAFCPVAVSRRPGQITLFARGATGELLYREGER